MIDSVIHPISIHQGWLSCARRVESPNYNARSEAESIRLLVIHNISLPPEQFGGPYIEQFFTNQLDPTVHPYFREIADLEVSSHLLITREGAVIQFVGFNQRAWHAGQSSFNGQENCNDFSIGIELEGADIIPYTEVQYAVLAQVTQVLMAEYSAIVPESIVGHSDIAPNRKTDPGEAFDWDRYRALLSFYHP
jgi:N-acetyl-anhydromuramoyl-L-alanine amidase